MINFQQNVEAREVGLHKQKHRTAFDSTTFCEKFAEKHTPEPLASKCGKRFRNKKQANFDEFCSRKNLYNFVDVSRAFWTYPEKLKSNFFFENFISIKS